MYSNKDLRKLLIPLIIEQVLNALMGIADTLMVSNVGAEALSGVSLVNAVNDLMILFISAMATGGTVVCSQYLGRKDLKNAGKAAGQVVLSGLVVSVIPGLLGAILTRPILMLCYSGVETGVMESAVIYFFITALSYPFLGLHQAAAALFRAEGETKTPMYVNFAANVLNVLGNALLIFVFDLGVAGAALSTLASRILAAAVLMVLLRSKKRLLRVNSLSQILPDGRIIRQVLKVGLPSGFERGLFQFGKLIVASTVSTLGTTAISAHAMVQLVEGIHGYPGQAIGIGLLTVTGTCMGAGLRDEVKKNTRKLIILSEISMLVMAAVILPLLRPISFLGSLTADAEKLYMEMMYLALFVKSFFWVPAFVLPETLKGAGDTVFVSLVSAASMWAFRVGLSFLLCRVFHVGLIGVWIGWYVDWLCRDTFFIIRYKSGKWAKKKVID